MDSFYGGKQGISFVIKEKFKTIKDMDAAFADPTHEKTWYGEYCIIQTESINNTDNGKIFRRTASRSSQNMTEGSTNYAEYIGKIVGPAGGIPNIELGDINTVRQNLMSVTPNSGSFYYQTPTSISTIVDDETSIINTYTYTSVTPSQSSDLYINTVTSVDAMYRSGKSYSETETPAFKYGFYTFQSNDATASGADRPLATLGIGFEIPYVDFENPTVTMVAQGTAPTVTLTTYQNNPFLYQYNFKLPAGGTGPYIGNEKIINTITGTTVPTIYNIEEIDYVPGRNPEYRLGHLNDQDVFVPAEPMTEEEFGTQIIVGEFIYFNGTEWVSGISTTGSSPDLFYIGEAPYFDNIVTQYSASKKQYVMYAKINGYMGDTQTISIAPSATEDGYKYIGPVGPPNLGPFTRQLQGQWIQTSENEIDIYITSPGPDTPFDMEGNLGVISTEQVIVPTGMNVPSTTNNVYFYIWDANEEHTNLNNQTVTGTWVQLGQQQIDSIYIESNVNEFDFVDSQTRVAFIAEPQQDKPDEIEIDKFEETPWK